MDRNRRPLLGEPWGDGSPAPLRFDSKREAERFIRDIPKALREASDRTALGKLSPEDNLWLRDALRELVKKNGGRVVRDTDFTLSFTVPKFPHVKRVVFVQLTTDRPLFWIENIEGAQGAGWNAAKPGKPAMPSNHINMLNLLGSPNRDTALRNVFENVLVDLPRVLPSNVGEVSGLKERRDMKPQERGWSTNPNTYGKPTFYEVLGTNLTPDSKMLVLQWLQANRPKLMPGHADLGHGASTENTLDWDPRQDAWIVTSRFWYTGG